MKSAKNFHSSVSELNTFGENILNEDIKSEPMFFNCDLKYALDKGGKITKNFLNALPDDWKNNPLVFDSRVHMLMTGWYPGIPGYHHDDVPRSDMLSGQPDYDNPKYRSEHILGLINAEVCPTKFVVGECKMSCVPDGELIYRAWHSEIETLIEQNKVSVITLADKKLYYFNCDAFHACSKAVSNGWRWFGRVSRNTDRVNEVTNEIRVNAQVYLEFPTEGW